MASPFIAGPIVSSLAIKGCPPGPGVVGSFTARLSTSARAGVIEASTGRDPTATIARHASFATGTGRTRGGAGRGTGALFPKGSFGGGCASPTAATSVGRIIGRRLTESAELGGTQGTRIGASVGGGSGVSRACGAPPARATRPVRNLVSGKVRMGCIRPRILIVTEILMPSF